MAAPRATSPARDSTTSDVEKNSAIHTEIAALSTINDPQSMTAHAEDPIEAKKVIRKIDYRLLPLMIFLYTLTVMPQAPVADPY